MNRDAIARFILERRHFMGLTQQALADMLHVTDKAVSKWERGLSYPDITLISPLAQALDVTERELLRGELDRVEEPCPPAIAVQETLAYAGELTEQRGRQTTVLLFILFSAVLVAAALVCTLCDLLLQKGLTWSPVVAASCALAWGAVSPLLLCRRFRLVKSTALLTLLLFPLLLAISSLCPGNGWLYRVAVPISAVSLAALWIMVLLCSFFRWRIWSLLSAGILLCGGLNLCIDQILVRAQIPNDNPPALAVFDAAACLALAALCLAIGHLRGDKDKKGRGSL